MRWGKGIRAVIGESFAEIFFGNCLALGIPCVSVDAQVIETLMTHAESDPSSEFRIDLEGKTMHYGDEAYAVELPEGARQALISGRWDSTGELLDARQAIAKTAEQLPYFDGWVS